jgi:hypothetical protein
MNSHPTGVGLKPDLRVVRCSAPYDGVGGSTAIVPGTRLGFASGPVFAKS